MSTDTHQPLTAKEKKERRRLHDKWMRRTATRAELQRARELDRRAAVDARIARAEDRP